MAQLLNQIIKALFIHVLGVLLIITLFHMYYSSQDDKYKIATEQIEGLSYIYKFAQIKNSIQKIRDLYQLKLTTSNKLDKQNFEKRIVILKKEIEKYILELKDLKVNRYSNFDKDIKEPIKNIKDLIKTQNLDAITIFKEYSSLITKIEKLYIVIIDRFKLQLESQISNYFLMHLTINNIPQIKEDFSKLRGYGSYLLESKKLDEYYVADILFYMQNQQRKLQDIETYISLLQNKKISFDDIEFMFNRLKNNTEKLNSMIESVFIKKTNIINGIDYFNFTNQIITDTDEFFLKTYQYLNKELQDKKNSIKTQLFYAWILVTIILLGLITALTISIIKIFREENIKYKDFILKDFKHKLQASSNLKEVCDVSLNKFCRYYKTLTGVIYLYNPENQKLYLGATYGLHEDSIDTVISMGETDIGQVAKDMNPIYREIKEQGGNILLPASKNIYIEPIIHEDELVAVIQYMTNYKINDTIDISTAFYEIMSSYIYDSNLLKNTKEMIEIIDDNIITSQTNIHGIIINVSNAFANISGYTKDEMIGKNHNILRHPDMDDEIFENLWQTITNGESWTGELKNLKKDGEYYWVKMHIYPNYDLYKNIIGYTAIRQEITDKKHIEELSIRDSMTSLYNRRYFESIFNEVLTKTRQRDSKLIFAMIDVDHFKLYNDTYGHQQGDITLKAVADILKEHSKSYGEYVFRLGGEEFGILFETTSTPSAYKLLNAMKTDVENLNIKHQKNTASGFVTISIGFFVIEPDMNLEINQIYKYADEALYKAKENGRNCIESNFN